MQTAEMMEIMSLNPDILGFLNSIARLNTVEMGTQTEDAGTGASKEHAKASRHAWPQPHTARGFARDPTPNHEAAVPDLHVYMPWTGMIIELLPTKKELHENDFIFTSTQSQGEMKKTLCDGARLHLQPKHVSVLIKDSKGLASDDNGIRRFVCYVRLLVAESTAGNLVHDLTAAKLRKQAMRTPLLIISGPHSNNFAVVFPGNSAESIAEGHSIVSSSLAHFHP
jgi:hypothetical protein